MYKQSGSWAYFKLYGKPRSKRSFLYKSQVKQTPNVDIYLFINEYLIFVVAHPIYVLCCVCIAKMV